MIIRYRVQGEGYTVHQIIILNRKRKMNDFNHPNADFFKEEVRNGYLVTEQMKRVWACELDMLNHLLEVCRKYDLKCWADAGTLLGAVRHKGFIPWDDDIDVIMMRDDYDKLVAISEKEFESPYFFQTIYSDKHYGNRHAQIRNSETAAIANPKHKYNQGIFIDIFVYDGVSDFPRIAQKEFRKVKIRKLILKIFIKATLWLPDAIYNKCRWDKVLYKKYEDVLRSYPISKTELIAKLSLNYKTKIKNKNLYEHTEYLDFENIQIPVPSGYHDLLRIDYGDYMTPRNVPTGHGTLKYDTEQSYKNVSCEL